MVAGLVPTVGIKLAPDVAITPEARSFRLGEALLKHHLLELHGLLDSKLEAIHLGLEGIVRRRRHQKLCQMVVEFP